MDAISNELLDYIAEFLHTDLTAMLIFTALARRFNQLPAREDALRLCAKRVFGKTLAELASIRVEHELVNPTVMGGIANMTRMYYRSGRVTLYVCNARSLEQDSNFNRHRNEWLDITHRCSKHKYYTQIPQVTYTIGWSRKLQHCETWNCKYRAFDFPHEPPRGLSICRGGLIPRQHSDEICNNFIRSLDRFRGAIEADLAANN